MTKLPLHYLIEPLRDGRIAIWRMSQDHNKTYSVTEITPKLPPNINLDDQYAALRQAIADVIGAA